MPSLSKVAIRSGGGTKSGPPSRVTRATKSTIDFFAAPSFHDGSGSAAGADAVAAGAVGVASLLQAGARTSHSATRLQPRRDHFIEHHFPIILLEDHRPQRCYGPSAKPS